MATSGSFRTKGWYSNDNGDYVYLLFDWSLTSQSIEDNSSVISWSLKGDRTASGYVKAGGFKVVVDGDIVYSVSTNSRIELYDGTLIASGFKTIAHNTDGTRTFTASAQGGIFDYAVNSKGQGSWEIKEIPRKATITAAPNFNDEENPVLKYSNPAGSAVSALQACISFDGSNDDIAYRAISKTGSSYTFSLTTAERTTLRNYCKNAKSKAIKFYIRTTINGTNYHHSVSKTLSIVNAEPTISPTVTDSNANTAALTGDNKTFVKYCSNAAFAFNDAALKGATIKSRKITCGSKSSTAATGTLSAVESGQFTFTVTDSRGFMSEVVLARPLINYVKKTCDIKNASFSVDGTISFAIKGNAFNGSFGAASNALTVQYRYKENGGSYGSWTAVTATKSGNTYSASAAISGFDYTKKYVIQARVTDSIGTTTSSAKTLSCVPVFDWGENDFSVNAPLYALDGVTIPRAGGAGLTGTATSGERVSALQACNNNDELMLGYGSYSKEIGAVKLCGNELHLYSKGSVDIHSALKLLSHLQIPNNTSLRAVDTNGDAKAVLYLGNTNGLALGHTSAASAHGGNTSVNALNGTIFIRNKNDSLIFEPVTSDTYSAYFRPNSDSKVTLGTSSNKWYRVYASNGTIATSDEREKHDISTIGELSRERSDGNILELLFDRLIPKVFYLNADAKQQMHIGFIAQDIAEALEALGLHEEALGVLEHDSWQDEETGQQKDRYGLAYHEFIALNSYMIQKQQQRITALEERLKQLEERLNAPAPQEG